MLSHISKPAQDVSSGEEEDILIPAPQHTSPLPIPPTNPYSTFSTSFDQLNLSHKQLRDNFYSMSFHFAASQRLVELHLTRTQRHLGYEISPLSQYIHPLPSTDPPFPSYDPWPIPVDDRLPQEDTVLAGGASSSF